MMQWSSLFAKVGILESPVYKSMLRNFSIIFFKINISKIPTECQTVLDPDQALNYVSPDLGPNCLQRQKSLLADKELKRIGALIPVFWKINSDGLSHMDYPKYIDTRSIELSILYFKGLSVKISIK